MSAMNPDSLHFCQAGCLLVPLAHRAARPLADL